MYVKLFSDILQSSLWAQSSDVRVVWITMLALANQDGLVRATAPGIAHAARVSLRRTQAALELFQAPDSESRTPDNEGRRIERVDGGFLILNYEKYRLMCSAEKRREQTRERVRRFRERERNADVTHVTQSNACNAKQKHKQKQIDLPIPPKAPHNIGIDSANSHEPVSVGKILQAMAGGGSLLDRVVAFEPEENRQAMQPVWERRIAAGAPVQDWLDEISNRNESRPGVRESKGYNGQVDNPARWLQQSWNTWSKKHGVKA